MRLSDVVLRTRNRMSWRVSGDTCTYSDQLKNNPVEKIFMPTAYIVSAHGERPNVTSASSSSSSTSSTRKTTTVPAGFRVHFYVADGKELPNSVALQLYRDLLAGRTTQPDHTVDAGQGVELYSFWGMDHPNKQYSHIITLQTQASAGSTSSSSASSSSSTPSQLKPIPIDNSQLNKKTLASLFDDFKNVPGDIHWLACTGAQQNKKVQL